LTSIVRRRYRGIGSVRTDLIGGVMRRILMTAAGVIFFDTLLYGILIPLVPVYATQLAVSKGAIGAIFAIYGIPLILLSAPFGILADRVGRVRVLRGAMLLLAVATGVFALATHFGNVPLLVGARLVQGTAAAATWATALAMVADLGREDGTVAQKMVWVNISASAGTIAGPFLGGVLAGVVGPAGVFMIGGAGAIILAALIAPLASPIPTAAGESRSGKRDAQPNPFVGAVALIRRSRGLALVLVLTLLNGMLLGLNEIITPFHLREAYGASSRVIGLSFAALFIGSNVAQPFVARWSDRVGRLRPMLIGSASGMIVVALLVLPAPLALFLALFGVVGVTGAVFFTPVLPLVTEMARGEQTGMLVGTANTIWSLGYLIGPAIGGIAAGAFGRYAYLTSAVANALGLLIVLSLWRGYPAGRVRPLPEAGASALSDAQPAALARRSCPSADEHLMVR
jgi:MFS family permease